MTQVQYAVREVWERFKTAALQPETTPVQGLALQALVKWAETEPGSVLSPDRASREALAASVAGAALVDRAITKLAAAGRYTPEERDFLLDMNAQAAVLDLKRLLKTASTLSSLVASPIARGALAGTVIGGGLGAWKDDDNRLRGAVTYGLPGAVLGGLAGQGYQTWAEGQATQAKKLVDEAAAQKAQETAGQVAQQARAAAEAAAKAKAVDDAKRWHQNLADAAAMYSQHSDSATSEYAKHLRQQLHTYRDSIIEHAINNPTSVHKILVQAAGVDGGQKTLNDIVQQARTLHKNGN